VERDQGKGKKHGGASRPLKQIIESKRKNLLGGVINSVTDKREHVTRRDILDGKKFVNGGGIDWIEGTEKKEGRRVIRGDSAHRPLGQLRSMVPATK